MSATIESIKSSNGQLKLYNPSTGDSLGELTCHSIADVEAGLKRLRQSAAGYNKSPIRERTRLIKRFQKNVVRRMDEIMDTIVKETGKKEYEAFVLDLFNGLEAISYARKHAYRLLKREYRTSGVLVHKRAYVDHDPYGVAVVIAPWNLPFQLMVGPMVEALLAGNVVALKPSEHTSLTALKIKEVFDEAAGRSDLVEVFIGRGDVGEYLTTSPLTDVITFTGSTAIGHRVGKAAAEALKPVILEMGGKDPMLVLEDANLKRAAKAAVWGGFTNAGQLCVAIERIYVMESVYDKFMELVRSEMQKLSVGAKADDSIGAITTTTQYAKITGHIEDARRKGAVIETFVEADEHHIAPTLVSNVDHSMEIMTDETFGPELAVMKVSTVDEAVQLANSLHFGLSAYIFTKDERRAKRIARSLEYGTIAINDVVVQFGLASLPFGGRKHSGLGRLHGREGILAFSQPQAVVASRIKIPMELWWYDLGSKTYSILKRFIRIWYG